MHAPRRDERLPLPVVDAPSLAAVLEERATREPGGLEGSAPGGPPDAIRVLALSRALVAATRSSRGGGVVDEEQLRATLEEASRSLVPEHIVQAAQRALRRASRVRRRGSVVAPPKSPPGADGGPRQDAEEGKERAGGDSCVVCWKTPIATTLVHGGSGHLCCCEQCAAVLMIAPSPKCPVCMRPVETAIRTWITSV